jgi:two-component system, LytTR family, sensor kinase
MPDRLSIHEPVLVNTIGHCAGAIIFGILLYFFAINWMRAREKRSILPALAAVLAMLWNLGSLIALAGGPNDGTATDIITAASFSVLSLLPAVLLHISLEADHRAVWMSGYVLSVIAIGLHIIDLMTQAERFHYAALLLVTLGFGALTVFSVFLEVRQRNRAAGSRLAGAMALFLFAISFVHFGSAHPRHMWEGEIALHHAGLPLALLVILQDYRFLLLDTFLRFILNASLGAGAMLLCIRVLQSQDLKRHLAHPFDAGLLFVAACLALTAFVYLRNRMQRLLTRALFLRANIEEPLRELHELGHSAPSEGEYLNSASETIAGFFGAERHELCRDRLGETADLAAPVAVLDPANWKLPLWVEAIIPLRLAQGDATFLLLGSRKGGRRYLSEDFTVLGRLAVTVVEHVEQIRGLQMQQLVSQAELRALQAQINPHFLFNSLNTLYGTITRSNVEARRLVLNLADVFRYFLQTDRPLISVEEELKIVRAYLEIEELRLGSKLRSELEIDAEALTVAIPVLSIQPLVENAIKHGVAARAGAGFVRLRIECESDRIAIRITNSGEWKPKDDANSRTGIGLSNVRRRLILCYGEEANVEVSVANGATTVEFAIPVKRPLAALASA